MIRISKSPEVRKKELIDAALKLFMKKGYEQTAVSDIVKEIGVAQGTFYYHFKSKNELLLEVVKNIIFEIIEKIRQTAYDKEKDPVTKLNTFQELLNMSSLSNQELTKVIHQESNIVLHEKLASLMISGITPLLTKIIEEGKEKGVFKIKHPRETALYMFYAFGMFHEEDAFPDPESLERARQATEQCVSRILGIKEGLYKLDFSMFIPE